VPVDVPGAVLGILKADVVVAGWVEAAADADAAGICMVDDEENNDTGNIYLQTHPSSPQAYPCSQ